MDKPQNKEVLQENTRRVSPNYAPSPTLNFERFRVVVGVVGGKLRALNVSHCVISHSKVIKIEKKHVALKIFLLFSNQKLRL